MIRTTLNGVDLVFETDRRLFSPAGLDPGTAAMLAQVSFEPHDKVLDLGCGWGAVGIYAAAVIGADRVWMVDIDPQAVTLAARNAARNGVADVTVVQSDGVQALDETGFSKILSNPPFHADFAVPKRFIEKGFNRLAIGGSLWMVTRREAWYRNKLTAIFGGVRVRRADGYFVFEAVKKSATYANRG